MKKDIIGKRFGKLVVQNEYRKVKNGTEWLCHCDCGNYSYIYRGKLTSRHTQSCGCKNKKLNGLSDHKLYSVWSNMKDRCYNNNNHSYSNYGGKGIIIEKEWLNFMNFYNWSISNGYTEGLSIERIDPNGNYCFENCEWITISENVARANKYNHRRKVQFDYFGVSPDGIYFKFVNANEFAKNNNLNGNAIRRVARGERLQYKGWKFGYIDNV